MSSFVIFLNSSNFHSKNTLTNTILSFTPIRQANDGIHLLYKAIGGVGYTREYSSRKY